MGGSVAPGASNTDPDYLAQELDTFDIKVYRAQIQMVKEMDAKLRSLGVPFFGTKTELIRVGGEDGLDPGGFDGPKDEAGMIDEIELAKLQRRMLIILEELCSD